MLIGTIKGASVASANFAEDIKNYANWIRFNGNGCTTTSNGCNSLGNVFDFLGQLLSLEPVFSVIDNFQVETTEAMPPRCWIQENDNATSHSVTDTHAMHRDQYFCSKSLPGLARLVHQDSSDNWSDKIGQTKLVQQDCSDKIGPTRLVQQD